MRRLSHLFILFFLSAILLSACSINHPKPPPFEALTFEDSYTRITAEDGRAWEVNFELPAEATYSGVVRHAARWDDEEMPFMSHDILVTTQDLASPEMVDTWVMDHMLFYRYKSSFPQGRINLLHIIPANQEIYEQLKLIEEWDEVSIHGREVLRIDIFDRDGLPREYYSDQGCNTLLVTAVEILEPLVTE